MKEDKLIAGIRAVRHKISARFGHDVDRLCKYYMKRQQKHKSKLLRGRVERTPHRGITENRI